MVKVDLFLKSDKVIKLLEVAYSYGLYVNSGGQVLLFLLFLILVMCNRSWTPYVVVMVW